LRDEFFNIGWNPKNLSNNDFFEQGLYLLHEGIENSSLRSLFSNLALKNALNITPLEQTLGEN
jgi:hypothetical protein